MECYQGKDEEGRVEVRQGETDYDTEVCSEEEESHQNRYNICKYCHEEDRRGLLKGKDCERNVRIINIIYGVTSIDSMST